jgi:glycosyltransferase involved in cell wall biosynthesis
MKIVFLSHTPRNYLFKVGSYHLSNECARLGHEVLYVPSPLSPFHFLNLPKFGDADYWNVIKSRLQTLKPHQDSAGITNLTPFVFTPYNKGIFDRPEIPIRQEFTFNKIGQKLQNTGFDEVDLVIQDKVGLFFMRKFINARSWVYRATDDYSNMSRGPGKESIQMLEQKICNFANRILVTSNPLQQLFDERYNVEASVLRNGVDADHFTRQYDPPKEYASISKPIILYVGSLDERFDLQLLISAAKEQPERQYVIVGPESKERIPEGISNITALGPKPYEQVPAYMQHADIGILPLKMTEANHARSPMKIYEYGICGLPVVSTPLRELQNREEPFISFAEGAESFHQQISASLSQKERLSKIARRSSKENAWQSITQRMLNVCLHPESKTL